MSKAQYAHEKFDPRWNKVKLNQHSKSTILSAFYEPTRKALKSMEKNLVELFFEAHEYHLANLPEEVNKVRENEKMDVNYLRRSDSRVVRVKLTKTQQAKFGKGSQRTAIDIFMPSRHEWRKLALLRWYGTNATLIKGGTPIGRKLFNHEFTRTKLEDNFRTVQAQFKEILMPCRTVGGLLKKWPSAIEYIPKDWLGSETDKQLVGVNVTDFESNLKLLLKLAKKQTGEQK